MKKQIDELNNMTVAELRTYCRENKSLHTLSGVEIISKQKSELIKALTGSDILESLHDNTTAKGNNGNGNNNGGDLAQTLANAIQGKLNFKPTVDVEKVNKIVDEKLSNVNNMFDEKAKAFENLIQDKIAALNMPRTIEIKNLDTGKVKNIGRQHEKMEIVLRHAIRRLNVNMVGTAGSGKTYMAEQVAEALELPFYAISVGLQTSKSDLIGYMDANGNYVRTLLREAFEHGGVFLIDEIDAGNPNVLTVLNAMTSNSIAAFPDGMVKKHENFIVLAAANTYGRGNDRQYVGRNPIDGATLDRFAFVDIDIDEGLETALAPNATWCRRVQQIRKAIFDLKEKVICSPRATINGGHAINDGMTFEDAEDAFIFRGIGNDIKTRILDRIQNI